MAETVIMSQYPVSNLDLSQLDSYIVGDIRVLTVSKIVHNGYLNILMQLRQMRCQRLIILIPGAEGDVMLPVLRVVASLIRADEFYICQHNGKVSHWNGRISVIDASRLLLSFICGIYRICLAAVYLFFLSRRSRVAVDIPKALKSKRILYIRPNILQGLRAGGVVSHSRGVIKGFLDLGYRVDCFADNDFFDIDMPLANFEVVKPIHPFVVPRELNHFNLQSDFRRALRRHFGSRYDGLIYQRIAVGSIVGLVLSRFWRVPLILEYNGSEIWLAKNWGNTFFFEKLVAYIERSLIGHAHMIVTVSNALKKELIAAGVDEHRVVVCPNGVDTQQFQNREIEISERQRIRNRYGFSENDLIFTFVGTFGPWHGASVLAVAAKEIIREQSDCTDSYPSPIKFMFVGDGVEYEAVCDTLREEIAEGHVRMTGLVTHNQVPEMLSITDVCLTPTLENSDGSEFFGSPTKLFEYLAAGKPIVASAVGQVTDVMSGSFEVADARGGILSSVSPDHLDQAVGILVKPGNVDQLVDAIKLMAADGLARQRMSINGARLAREKFTWRRHVSDALDHLIKIKEQDCRLRLLINGLHSKSGGGVTYLKNVLPILAQYPQFEVHLVLHREQREIFKDVLSGIKCHELNFRQGFWRLLMREQIALPLLARKINADVTFSPANYGPLFAPNTVILLRNSLAVAFVERRAKKWIYWGLLFIASNLSMLRAKRVISVSDYALKSSAGLIRKLSRKFIIVPHGINEHFKQAIQSNRSTNELLVVSDLYIQKNLHSLLTAMPVIIKACPNVLLRIAGAPLDMDYANHLEEIVERTGIQQHVVFEGSVLGERLMELYRRCAIFVFPSTVETFGNPLVEAMAVGAPIACSNTAAMPEVAGDAAAYFDPYDVNLIAEVIISLLNDPQRREQLSAKAVEQAKRYSWEKTAAATAEALQSVSGRSCRGEGNRVHGRIG